MIWKDYDALTLSFAGLVYVTHLKMIDLLPLFSMISYSSSLSESHVMMAMRVMLSFESYNPNAA